MTTFLVCGFPALLALVFLFTLFVTLRLKGRIYRPVRDGLRPGDHTSREDACCSSKPREISAEKAFYANA